MIKTRFNPLFALGCCLLGLVASSCFIIDPGNEVRQLDAIDTLGSSDAADDTVDADVTTPSSQLCEAGQIRCQNGQPQACDDEGTIWVDVNACQTCPDDDDTCVSEVCRSGPTESEAFGCVELPSGYGELCVRDAQCPDTWVCYLGQCLPHAPGESDDCWSDLECLSGTFCNGLGRCSEGSQYDECWADSDCDGETPVCNPITDSCSTGDIASGCIGPYGCLEDLVCGPMQTCQHGQEGDPCEADEHCHDLSPICSTHRNEAGDLVTQCQDGGSGDWCVDNLDCANHAPSCDSGRCTTTGEGVGCSSGAQCQQSGSAPFCSWDDQCHNGSVGDPCDLDTECLPGLACYPDGAESGLCQYGLEGERCEGGVDSEDCAASAPICRDGTCQDGGGGDACDGAEDCAEQYLCAVSGTCAAGESGDSCEHEDDCREGLTCADFDDTHFCNGQEGDACEDDDDCDAETGVICIETYDLCATQEEKSLCEFDDDCKEDLLCAGFRCLPGKPGDVCLSNDDCDPALLGNYCGPEGYCRQGLVGDDCNQVGDCLQSGNCAVSDCIGNVCTAEIEDDTCLIDGTCYDEGVANPDADCFVCHHDSSDTSWTDDDSVCSLPNGASFLCTDGLCQLIDCLEGFEDCDFDQANGCEAHIGYEYATCTGCTGSCTPETPICDPSVPQCSSACPEGWTWCYGQCRNFATDPNHCVVCGNVCESGDTDQRALCNNTCGFEDCTTGTWDIDGSALNGCEYDCVASGLESCNGLDDDCDGLVDEDTDLFADEENCGSCGNTCAADNASASECHGGECHLVCDEGTVNRNGFSVDGCEIDLNELTANIIWVNNHSGGTGDGSLSAPYNTITAALSHDGPIDIIRIEGNAGDPYEESLEISLSDVELIGENLVIIDAPTAEAAIVITADNVTLDGLTVVGGQYAIHVQGTDVSPLGGRLHNIIASANASALAYPPEGEAGLEAAGVRLDYANDYTISLFSVGLAGITAGDANPTQTVAVAGVPAPGGLGAGIRLYNSVDVEITGCELEEVTGGNGVVYCSAGFFPNPSVGGSASGVFVEDCDDVVIQGCVISNVQGGEGAEPAAGCFGGVGGTASGLAFVYTTNAESSSNVIGNVTGGRGGAAVHAKSGGTGGIAAGVVLLSHSENNSFYSNLVSELNGGSGGLEFSSSGLAGADQEAFGFYLDVDSRQNTIALDNTCDGDPVAYLYGLPSSDFEGLQLTGPCNSTNLGKIVVIQSADVSISDNLVANFVGETGCPINDIRDGCVGLAGAGIYVDGCGDCVVEGNEVRNIQGGAGAPEPFNGSDPGIGGPASGIAIVKASGSSVSNNLIYDINGGVGGEAYGSSDPGSRGLAACIETSDAASQLVNHLTCELNLTKEGEVVVGVAVRVTNDDTGTGDVTVSNVIFDLASDTTNCIINESDSSLTVENALVHECSSVDTPNSSYSGVVAGPPDFATTVGNDPYRYRLRCDYQTDTPVCSPAIDTGSTVICTEEPGPNGCAVNLGSFGDTSEAAVNPNAADHCAPCTE